MTDDPLHRTLPVLGKRVFRLGLACSYGIDEGGIEHALCDTEINYLFWTPRMGRATPAVRRALARERKRYVVATGPTTAWWGGGLRRFVDRGRADQDVDNDFELYSVLPTGAGLVLSIWIGILP